MMYFHLILDIKQRTGIRNNIFFIFLFIIILSNFILLYLNVHQNHILLYLVEKRSIIKREEDAYIVDTEGCQIQALQLYDDNVRNIMKRNFTFLQCPKKATALVETNDTHIWIIKENLKYHYNFTKYGTANTFNSSSLRCCYQEFNRPRKIRDITDPYIDQRLVFNKCIVFQDIIEIKPDHEFLFVTCYYNISTVYIKLLASVPKKKMMKRQKVSPPPGNTSQYNVLVIGVDSVSRMNFHRAMPKTWEILKSLEAVELLGYNKVGDDTFANAVPLLMGLKHTSLQTTCVPHRKSNFDNCPLVWEWFKQAGYYTAFAEDTAKHGIFHYGRSGFFGFPTDYYLHPFNVLAETFGNNYHKKYKRNLCLQERFMFKVLLDYIEKLTKTLANNNLFGFFWDMNLSHDALNNALAIDGGYEELFRRLNESGYLKKTIVIFLSDHGMRFGPVFMSTPLRWWLETRLPFVFVLLPPSFPAKYRLAYNSLKLNTKRLTTPYDMHKTLLDLIDLKNIKNDAITYRSKQYYTKDTGISLFLPIPGNRTCEMAGIEDTWCTCHKTLPISVNGTEVKEAAKDLMIYLNNLLSNFPECATLNVSKILTAMEMKINHTDERRLTVSVTGEPGRGRFQATMRKVGKTWQPISTVSRLNRYGDQSNCINWYDLKLYCCCKDYKM